MSRTTTLLLDTHALYWSASDPAKLSRAAFRATASADQLGVASVTWFELAQLALMGKIEVPMPLRSWLASLAEQVNTIPMTPAIAVTAAELPRTFPGDPADRIIYATAIELGCQLVTKDGRMRTHKHSRRITIW